MSIQPPNDPTAGELHLDLDALCDVLAEESTIGQRAHLLTCARCSAELTKLDAAQGQVVAALGALPLPELPVGLAARLETAVADERRGANALEPATNLAEPISTVVPVTRRKDRRPTSPRLLPWAGGLAAAAVLVCGGLWVGTGFLGKSDSSATATAARAVEMVRNDTGNAYAKDGKALTAALPSLLHPTALAAPQAVPPKASLDDLQPRATAGMGFAGAPPLAALRSNQGLAGCLSALTDPSVPGLPLAIDYGSFDSQPALVVVLPSTVKDKVDVFIVGSGCTPADAQVLFFMRLTKPS